MDKTGSLKRARHKILLALVWTHMEQLATATILVKLDTMTKRKFADCFEDLPHTDNLPTDIYHYVKLKDVNQVIDCWGYACPQKYKDT